MIYPAIKYYSWILSIFHFTVRNANFFMSASDSDYVQSSRQLTEMKRSGEYLTGRHRAALREIQPIQALITTSTKLESISEDVKVSKKSESFTFLYENGVEPFYCSVRSAQALQPSNMRHAQISSRKMRARRPYLFRPGFNDGVNDCIRLDRDVCLLSTAYRENDLSRSLFFKQVTFNRDWIAMPSLVRKIDQLFYLRAEFTDVVMFHPTAWGFPEADLNPLVVGIPGRERDPMHGWLSQESRNADSEMKDALFSYNFTVRRIPQTIIDLIVSGSLPDWLQGIADIRADVSKIAPLIRSEGKEWGVQSFLRAGLIDEEDVYLKVGELGNTRLLEPDVLDATSQTRYSVRGLNGLRSCLAAHSRSAHPITPAQVSVMAFQLGIWGNFHYYWFALFALRYPIPNGWTLVVSENVLSYIDLKTERPSLLHPLLSQFKRLLTDWQQSEILFDVRGSFTPPCDECGTHDAVVTCCQCFDLMCVDCFLSVHERRRSHWAVPVAGCRYLTEEEAERMSHYIPATNVGFCNRRRFLARSNQSDKTGPCQCCWLHFDSDVAFDSVYAGQCVEGSSPDTGFFYNFESHAIVFSSDAFSKVATLEQTAALKIQKFIRGFICRQRLYAESSAAVVIQKNIRMILARRRFGRSRGDNALIVWFQMFKLRMQRDKFFKGVRLVQAHVKRIIETKRLKLKKEACVGIQAFWRGLLCRKRLQYRNECSEKIQSAWRGWFYGRKSLAIWNESTACIQARARGILARKRMQQWKNSAIIIQALVRGVLCRGHLKIRQKSAILIQTWWRRFTAINVVKGELIKEITLHAKEYDELIRTKSMNLAAVEIQRVFRGHFHRRKYFKFLQSRISGSRSVSSIVSMFVLALTNVHDPFHHWIRYLPESLRDKLHAFKGILQRAIVNSGDSVAECIIKEVVLDALTTCGEEEGTNDHIYWISHSICHLAGLGSKQQICGLRTIPFGIEIPKRIDDPLIFFQNLARRHESVLDSLLRIEKINYSVCALREKSGASALTSFLLITYREFLKQPRLRPESMLTFQGVDSVSAAQLLDIVGFDLGFPELPCLEWAKSVGKTCCANIEKSLKEFISLKLPPIIDGRKIDFFSSDRVWRSFKLLGKFLRGHNDTEKFNRHLIEIRSLIGAARAQTDQDHYAYIVAVVLIHIVHRGLIMREMSQRAAISIQVAFKYYKTRTVVKRIKGPVLTIQRYWRGLSAALVIYRKDRAASMIQNNLRIILRLRRNEKLQSSVLFIQSVWRGAIQRKWILHLQRSALKIQKIFRGHVVRLVLGSKEGRSIRRAFRERVGMFSDAVRMAAVKLEFRKCLEEFKVKTVASKRSRAKIAQKKIDQYRKAMQALKTSSSTPIGRGSRQSVFEPASFAIRRKQRELYLNSIKFAENEESIVPAAEKINRQLDAWLKLI